VGLELSRIHHACFIFNRTLQYNRLLLLREEDNFLRGIGQ
jgi:hypothetical protein